MRAYLFNKGKNADSLPPTSDALKLHISRAHYQTTVWLNAAVPFSEHMDLEICGWEPDPHNNQLTEPKLLLLEPVPKVCTELLQCTCKKKTQEDANADKTILHAFRLWISYMWQSTDFLED